MRMPATNLRTVRDLLRLAVTRMAEEGVCFGHGQTDTVDEAIFLVLRALKLPLERADLFLDAALTAPELDRIAGLIERRVRDRVPAAYLLNEAWLQGHRFYVDERTIVPRSFIAELLLNDLAPWIADPEEVADMLDLCTGSGCLAVLAAASFPNAAVDAVDLSDDALAVARRNIDEHGLAGRITPLQSDLFDAIPGRRYDLILSNPPYVTEDSMARLPAEYRHEPRMALAAGADGLDLVRRILAESRAHLKPGGMLVVEVGDGREAVEQAFPDLPLTWLTTSAGDDMVFLAQREDLR
jgi:ribosomal protein L3 glutamine methyltransferase